MTTHIQTTGRVSDDAVAMLTHGQISLRVEGETLSVIWTRHAPLSKGDGSGRLAELNDVTVRVNGTEATVVGIKPVAGGIVVDQTIPEESDVEVDYSYLKHETRATSRLSEGGHIMPSGDVPLPVTHAHDPSFLDSVSDQPRQIAYRWDAWDTDYTARLNDPTSLRFNEPVDRSFPSHRHELTKLSVSFEGQDGPDHPPWTYHGSARSSNTSDGEHYTLHDTETASDHLDGSPSYFSWDEDIESSRRSQMYYRMKLNAVDLLEGDWTGMSVGWSSDRLLAMASYLEIGDHDIVAILEQDDEDDVTSYRGITSTVQSSGQDITSDLLEQTNLSDGDAVIIDGQETSVTSVDGNTMTVSDSFPSQSDVNVMPTIDVSSRRTYQIVFEGEYLRIYVDRSKLVSSIHQSDLPQPHEPSANIRPNQVFWGSLSREATNESEWDFIRFSSTPQVSFETTDYVRVRESFDIDRPEQSNTPWIRYGPKGHTAIENNDHLFIEQGGDDFHFHRVEPSLDDRYRGRIEAQVRPENWGDQFPVFLTISDRRREATVALFEDPVSLDNHPVYRGRQTFGDKGWTNDDDLIDYSFEDRYGRLDFDGSVGSTFSATGRDSSSHGSPVDVTANFRLRVNQFTFSNGRSPLALELDAGIAATLRFEKSSFRVFDSNSNVIGTIDETTWDDLKFHTYQINISNGNLVIIIDRTYELSAPLSSFAGSHGNPPYDMTLRLHNNGANATVDIDYLYMHDMNYGARKIGLYEGGDRSDPDNYRSTSFDWLNQDAHLQMDYDRDGADVYIDHSSNPDLSMTYTELPERNERSYINSESGFVEFGSFEHQGSRVQWDEVSYDIELQEQDRDVIHTSRFNQANQITSSEPIFDDDPERAAFDVYDGDRIELDDIDDCIDRVIQVRSTDDQSSYDFTYHPSQNQVVLDSTIQDDHVDVIFYAGEPYTHSYLDRQTPDEVLYEETPPFSQTNTSDLSVQNEWDTQFNDLNSPFNDPSSHLSDTNRTITYTTTSEGDALLSDPSVTSEDLGGSSNLLRPAYDQNGPFGMVFDRFTDTYQIPSPVNPGWSHNKPFILDDTNPDLDDPSVTLDAGASSQASEVRGGIDSSQQESYQSLDDEYPSGTIEDYDGAMILDSTSYQLDDMSSEPGYGELDVYSASTTSITFYSTFNWP